MSEKNPIELRVKKGIEMAEGDVVDYLLDQFPQELQSRLLEEIDDLDDARAIDYLTTKLVNRRFALRAKPERLPNDIQVLNEYPLAIAERIKNSKAEGDESFLGNGFNGEVIKSKRQPNTCYKVLFSERAEKLFSTASREALMQHMAYQLLSEHPDVAQVPRVLRYVDHPELRAIQMDRINGCTFKQLCNGECGLPEHFDLELCLTQLQRAVEILNEGGIFHRDLTFNDGNVMIDSDGKPWIIDFGSAVKSVGSNDDPRFYRLSATGPLVRSTDQGASDYLRSQFQQRGALHLETT